MNLFTPRINIRVTAELSRGIRKTIRSHSKRRMLAKLRHVVAEKYYLRVSYAPEIYNDGYYTSKDDLLSALRCFTDPDEVRFIRSYNGIHIKGEQ